jgi:hypothetical protein
MAMDKDLLAEALWAINGPVIGPDGVPVPATDGVKAYADGFISMLKAGIVAHLPGTVLGSAPPGSALKGGNAQGGKILALAGPVMAAIAAQGNPIVAAAIALEATAIATYFMAAALVSFTPETIEGTSTETTAPSPGPLTGGKGAGTGLQITGVDGGALAPLLTAATAATGPLRKAHADVLCNHVKTFATVEYTAGTVIGTMTGGQLVGGAGAGGKIS